jgi:hypothetical protein
MAGLALSIPLPVALPAQEKAPQQHLEITGSRQLRITYDFTATWPRGGGYIASLYLPVPPETGNQHIEHFSSSLKGQISPDDANPPHQLLTGTLHHDSGDERRLRWHVEIIGRFQTRQLVDGPPDSARDPIVAPTPGAFLASTESINWNTDPFRAWLDSSGLVRKEDEPNVDYARRLFAYMRSNGRYSYPPETPWNAAAVCRHLRTDCGGFSLVFTAACRANKIPARLLAGQWFKARKLPDGSVVLTDGRQSHVIAEFFDPRIGWIPEDISSTFLKTPGYPDLNFFGRDPGYFFTWHLDTDFHFDTPQKPNAHVQWIQNPAPWFSANASDIYDSISHHWDIEPMN